MKPSRFVYWLFALVMGTALLVMNRSAATSAHLRTLLVGTGDHFPPFTYRDEAGEWVGFEIELLEALAKESGLQLVYSSISFPYNIPGVATRLHDIGAGCIFITEDRKQFVAFGAPYFSTGTILVVNKANSEIQTYRDLTSSMAVAVLNDSKSEEFVRNNTPALVVDSLSMAEAFEQIAQDQLDGVALDEEEAYTYLREDQGKHFKVTGELLAYYECGFAFNLADVSLLRQFDNALATLKSNGVYDKLYAKWFGQRPQPTKPPTPIPTLLPSSDTTHMSDAAAQPVATPEVEVGLYHLTVQAEPVSYELVSLAPGGFWFSTALTQSLVNSRTIALLPTGSNTQPGTWHVSSQQQITASVIMLHQDESPVAQKDDATLPASQKDTELDNLPGTPQLLRKDYQMTISQDGTVNGVYIASAYTVTQANSLLLPSLSITYSRMFTGYRVQE